MIYQVFALSTNLSNLATNIQVQHEAMRSLERGSAEPGVRVTGALWLRTDYPALGEAVVQWTGSAWRLLADPEFPQLNAGGTVALAANLPAGGHKLTGLAAATANGEAVRYEQTLLRDGTLAATGDLNLGTHNIVALADPTADQHAATKHYVDAEVGALSSSGDDALTFAGFNASATISAGFVPKAITITMYPVAGAGTRELEGLSVAVALGAAEAACVAYGRNTDSANTPDLYDSKLTATPHADGTVDIHVVPGHGASPGTLKTHHVRWVAVR